MHIARSLGSWPHGCVPTLWWGKSTRIGVYKCKDCRKPFTVKVGTIFEDSHIPLRLWLQASALLCASKKGITSNQLHRVLGVTLVHVGPDPGGDA
jgi:transposase-like protein